MDKKRFEKTKVMVDNARKSMAEDLKTIREGQENLRKIQLVMEALDELFKENAVFRKQFESKLTELSLKEEVAIQE
jgi:hypothetical protein